MTKLTGTFSKVAAYEFTTLTCIPGVFHYKGAKMQLLGITQPYHLMRKIYQELSKEQRII